MHGAMVPFHRVPLLCCAPMLWLLGCDPAMMQSMQQGQTGAQPGYPNQPAYPPQPQPAAPNQYGTQPGYPNQPAYPPQPQPAPPAQGQPVATGSPTTWVVTRTLVTPVVGLPQGYRDQQLWRIAITGSSATLTTQDGSVNGTLVGSSWVFETNYTDPRVMLPAHLKIQLIGMSPLMGTLENTLFDPNGFRPPSTEAFRLDGVRQ
jgi:hypothetical protein